MPGSSRLTSRLAVAMVAALLASLAGPVAPTLAATSVTKVGTSSNGSSKARRSITLKRPAKTVAGHVMVASIVDNDDDPITAPAGWTLVRKDSISDTLHQAVYVKVAGSKERKSYTWKVPDWRRLAGGITTYAGVDTTHPVDAQSGSANRTAAPR